MNIDIDFDLTTTYIYYLFTSIFVIFQLLISFLFFPDCFLKHII